MSDIKELKFANLWNGEEIIISASEFDLMQSEFNNHAREVVDKILSENLFDMKRERKKEKEFYFECISKIGEYKFNLIIDQIKNSGLKDGSKNKKRMHVKKKFNGISEDGKTINFINEYPIIIIGIIDIGDKIILTISEDIRGRLWNKRNSNNNSSFWISYKYFKEFASSEFDVLTNKISEVTLTKMSGDISKIILDNVIKNYDWNNEDYDDSKETKEDDNEDIFNFTADDYIEEDYIEEDYIEDFKNVEILKINNSEKFKRNIILKENYLKKMQKCENCLTDETFNRRKDGLMYFEIHHIIPFNSKVQSHYSKLLDSEINLVSLCPNCHRKIHLSNEKTQKEVLTKIYENKVDDKFIRWYPEVSLDKLLENYRVTYGIEMEEEKNYE